MSTLFTYFRVFNSICTLTFTTALKVNLIIISSNYNNCNIIEAHGFLCHTMTTATYLWLESKIYFEKVLVVVNITLTPAATFVFIYVIRYINSVMFQHLYLTQLT